MTDSNLAPDEFTTERHKNRAAIESKAPKPSGTTVQVQGTTFPLLKIAGMSTASFTNRIRARFVGSA